MATPPTFSVGGVLTAAQMNQVGQWLMIPTSISGTGATLSNGKITLSSCTAVTINGIFTGDFENYLLLARLSFTGGDTTIQLTASGTAAGSNYNYSQVQAYAGAGVTTARTAGAANIPIMSNQGGVYGSASVDIFAPQLSVPTMFQAGNLRNDGAYGTPANYLWFGNNSNSTSYDGLKITGGGAMTGTIMVYGRTM